MSDRTKRGSAPRITEDDVEKQIRDYLLIALLPGVEHFHVPNGAKLGARQVWQMKAAGMKAGIPDRCFLYQGRAYFIEVKKPGGVLSDSQRVMFPKIRTVGCPVEICRSVEDVERALVAWGIPLKARILPIEGAA